MRADPFYSMLLDRLAAAWSAQSDKPEETPESTLKALAFFAAGIPVSVQKASREPVPELGADARTRLRTLVDERLAGCPLAHLTGRQEFLGMELLAGPAALIPRSETEILGRAALSLAAALADERGAAAVLDVCTGSGNIALVIGAHEPRARVFGSDISEDAVALARANAALCRMDHRMDFRTSDLFAAFATEEFYGRMDLVTCNPPYISSAKAAGMDPEISQHEPRLAFDGGSLGITILTRLIREAPAYLKPRSYLCFEVGLGQGKAMEQRLERDPRYGTIRSYTDSSGQVRALSAQTV